MYTTQITVLTLLFTLLTPTVFATPKPVSQPLNLATRQTQDIIVQCNADVFQNPDDDIAAVVCQADAKCNSGDDEATEVVDARGGDAFEVTCFSCPAAARSFVITDGCAFV